MLENIATPGIIDETFFFWNYLLERRNNIFFLTAPSEKGVLIGIGTVSLAKVNNIVTNIVIARHKDKEKTKKFKENVNNTIIVTRPKPAYGRQGLAGSWGQDTYEVSTF